MDKKINALFGSEIGSKIYSNAISCISEYNMHELISSGVLIGFSGGPDSVMLLCFLYEYRKRNSYFPITACHINHMIRGDDADADESFSESLCKSLGIDFISYKINVPLLSKEYGLSLEESARNERYTKFSEIIESRNDISAIAVAHNANDNLETVMLNIFRGSGTRGAAGIPPVRGNIIRPLLGVKKSDILSALEKSDIGFVIDKTNSEVEYKRNRVRHKVIPTFYEICDDPISMVTRFSQNLRQDDDYINLEADKFLFGSTEIKACELRDLHKAVQLRVLSKMAKSSGADLSSIVIDSICSLLKKDDFSVSLPNGATFVCERGVCSIKRNEQEESYDYFYKINKGETQITEYDSVFLLSEDKSEVSSLNVYKISIHADISSAIIVGDLYLRPRINGDTIFYGGITRKVKTLFADAKIPKNLRKSIPLLCDDRGIVWIPGFGVRDDGGKNGSKKLFASLAIGKNGILSNKRFRCASEYR